MKPSGTFLNRLKHRSWRSSSGIGFRLRLYSLRADCRCAAFVERWKLATQNRMRGLPCVLFHIYCIFLSRPIAVFRFACSVIYYGVAFNTSNMGGNPYINCLVAAAVEIPAYTSVIVLLKWYGRKPILICTLLVSGIACAATAFLETGILSLLISIYIFYTQ